MKRKAETELEKANKKIKEVMDRYYKMEQQKQKSITNVMSAFKCDRSNALLILGITETDPDEEQELLDGLAG